MSVARFSIPIRNSKGIPLVESDKRRGKPGTRSIDIISQDLCIQSSWFQQSTLQEDVPLTNSGDDLTYTGDLAQVWINPYFINAQEGRFIQKDGTFKNRLDYKPVFKESGTVIPDSDINWVTLNYGDMGYPTVTFNTPKNGAITITSSYVLKTDYYYFIVQPPVGHEIFIAFAEIQFATDVDFETSKHWLRFEALIGAFGLNEFYQPSPVEFHEIPRDMGFWDNAQYNRFAYYPDPSVTAVLNKHLGSRQDYMSTRDFEYISNVGKNTIKPWGGRNYETIEFPFNYLAGIPLTRAVNSGIRVYVMDTGDLGGSSQGALPGSTASFTLYTEWSET